MRVTTAVLGAALFASAGISAQPPGPARRASSHSPYGQPPALPASLPAMPRSGAVATLPSSQLQPGMKGVAWTVFQGVEPEAVPVEIIGLWKNSYGPRQDVILAKLGGKAAQTNVAGGMSGSPVYIDGKLIGAIALRISVFSPDAICGITPIEQMLEINAIDDTRPANPKTPLQTVRRASLDVPASLLSGGAQMVPIDTPLALSGFHEATLREFRPYFEQMGVTAVLGGAAGTLNASSPAPGWQNALQPGQAIAGVLVSGDMSVTGLGTVTYNDGKRVLGFGHSFFNLGPVNMPMAAGEVLMVLSSQFQPNKFANATHVAGALRQDRHAGIMGELGATAETIPVSLKVRTQSLAGAPATERTYHFNVFVHPKWTPFLMMLTTYNSLQDINAAASDEATFRLRGKVEFEGLPPLDISTIVASGDAPMPAPMQVGAWWAERFSRLYLNPNGPPKVKRVDAVLEMSATRESAVVESAWLESSEVAPGGLLTGKVTLRPWRGDKITREFRVKLPAGLARGEHRLVLGDAAALNRGPGLSAMVNRDLDLAQTVRLLNQEKSADRLYISLVQSRPTIYDDDLALKEIPASVLNVMQSGRGARPLAALPESVETLDEIALSQAVSGSATLRFKVR